MTKTKFGYLHSFYGPDMDGTKRIFEWVDDAPMPNEPGEDVEELEAGWFAECEIHPEAGWIGSFETELEAINVATNEDRFTTYVYGDDPMGDHHGSNV